MEVKKQHYGAIDGLRTYASIGVLIMHVLLNGKYNISGFITERFIGSMGDFVFLFMMISGFSMCCGYFDKISGNKITFGEFYSKRFIKIWPFFALLCLIDIAVSPSLTSIYEAFVNLTLCFGFLPNPKMSVIGVAWFIGIVFVFYLIFPFFCYLLQNKLRAWTSFVIMVVFNILCEVYFLDGSKVVSGFDARGNIIYCSAYFFAGGLIFLYKEKISEFCKRFRYLVLLASVFAAVMFFIIGKSLFTLMLLFALMLIYAIGDYKKAYVLENPVTKFISGISMEIYLCHMLIFRILEKINLIHLFANSIVSYVITALLTLVGAIAFSVAVKKGFDIIKLMIKHKEKTEE